MNTFYFFTSLGMLVLLLIALFRVLKKYQNLKYRYDKVYELAEQFATQNEEMISELNAYSEHFNLFKSYYNKDWSRDTPFLGKIDALSYFWRYEDITKFPVSIKIKDIPITKIGIIKNLKDNFGKDWDIIEEFSLENLLLFSADLKSYRENYDNLNPDEYYQKRLNFIFKNY